MRSTSSPRSTFSKTGPLLTTFALIGCIARNFARRASIKGMVFNSNGRFNVRAVRSKVSSMFARTRRLGSNPGTWSKTTAGGVEILSRIISVRAPISKSQCAPEICSNCSSFLTSLSQSRRLQDSVVVGLTAVAVAITFSLDKSSMLLDELHRAGMKNIRRRNVSRADALSMTIAQKSIEHMPVRFEPVRPGIRAKNPLLLGQIMIGPRFD